MLAALFIYYRIDKEVDMLERNITVAVDAMGGDNAPYEIVKGVAEAVKLYPVKVLLVGQEEVVKKELAAYTFDEDSIEIVNADEVISFGFYFSRKHRRTFCRRNSNCRKNKRN